MPVTITRTAWIDDDGSGTTGTVINNAEKTLLYNQIDEGFAKLDMGASGDLHVAGAIYEYNRAVPQGAAIDVPFSAADFIPGESMIWTVEPGDVITNAYALVGKQLTWHLGLDGTQVSGTMSALVQVRLPAGLLTARKNWMSVAWFDNGGSLSAGVATCQAGAPTLSVSRLGGATLVAGSLTVCFTVTLLVL